MDTGRLPRPRRMALAIALLGTSLASSVRAQEAAESITPEEFRRLDPQQADGKRYQIVYQKYLKLFGEQLKLHGGVNADGRAVYHTLAARLLVRDAALAKRLLANRDARGRALISKESNIHLFGTARRTARGLVLLVDDVRLLDSQKERFERQYERLKPRDAEGAAQQRDALADQIERTVAGYPEDVAETAPLVAKLREEARQIIYAGLPALPAGAAARVATGWRYRDVALLGEVWFHPDVAPEDKAAAEQRLEALNARRYRGAWLTFEAFQEALGFAQDSDGQWVPQERLWLEAAAEREKRRLSQGLPQVPFPRGMLQTAMANGQILRGMPKLFVVAAFANAEALGPSGAFPVRVETYEEVIDDAERSWELWVMQDGTQVYFLGDVVTEKVERTQ